MGFEPCVARDGEVARVDLERERGQIPKAWEALDGVPNRRSKNRIASESEHMLGVRGVRDRVGAAVCMQAGARVKRTDARIQRVSTQHKSSDGQQIIK